MPENEHENERENEHENELATIAVYYIYLQRLGRSSVVSIFRNTNQCLCIIIPLSPEVFQMDVVKDRTIRYRLLMPKTVAQRLVTPLEELHLSRCRALRGLEVRNGNYSLYLDSHGPPTTCYR